MPAKQPGLESVLIVEELGRPVGAAALVDSSGLLVTHVSSVKAGVVSVRTRTGLLVGGVVVSQDPVTQTVLVQIPPVALPDPLRVARELKPGAVVYAVGGSGQASGQVAAVDRVGQMRPSLRYLPLSEVWLEAGPVGLGPAVLLDRSGALVGILGATLGEGEGAQKAAPAAEARALDYGPNSLQVSYAVSPAVLARVVEGFLSPGRKASHPTIGVFFRMSPGAGGVILESVQPGSSSEAAGLRAGDKIVSVDGKPVARSSDLAALLFQAKPGQRIEIVYERDGERHTASVVVQSQELALMCRTIQRQPVSPL